MSELARDTLCRTIQYYGRSLMEDPQRLERTLRELVPKDVQAVDVLVEAVRHQIAKELVSSADPAGAVESLSKRLAERSNVAADSARWAVESWAIALGLATAESLKPRPGPRLPPAPSQASPAEGDYYAILGLGQDAATAGVDRAYEEALGRIAERTPPQSPARANEIRAAYEARSVLRDPEKRSRYDRFGRAGLTSESITTSGFGMMFDDLFNGGAQPNASKPPSQASAAAGAKPGTRRCPTCDGRGRVQDHKGFFTLERTCPACQGSAQVADGAAPQFTAITKSEMERLAQVLTAAAAERRVSDQDLLRVRNAFFGRDERGNVWAVGLKTRQWNRRDGSHWVAGTPPEQLSIATGTLQQLTGLERPA